MRKPKVWIESDILGSKHVMIQAEGDATSFCYCTFNYRYPYTDNRTVWENAQDIACKLLDSDEPIREVLRGFHLSDYKS